MKCQLLFILICLFDSLASSSEHFELVFPDDIGDISVYECDRAFEYISGQCISIEKQSIKFRSNAESVASFIEELASTGLGRIAQINSLEKNWDKIFVLNTRLFGSTVKRKLSEANLVNALFLLSNSQDSFLVQNTGEMEYEFLEEKNVDFLITRGIRRLENNTEKNGQENEQEIIPPTGCSVRFTCELCVSGKDEENLTSKATECYWHADGFCRRICSVQDGCVLEGCNVCSASRGVQPSKECPNPCQGSGTSMIGCKPHCKCMFPEVTTYYPAFDRCIGKSSFAIFSKAMNTYFKKYGAFAFTPPASEEASEIHKKVGAASQILAMSGVTLPWANEESITQLLELTINGNIGTVLRAYCTSDNFDFVTTFYGRETYFTQMNTYRQLDTFQSFLNARTVTPPSGWGDTLKSTEKDVAKAQFEASLEKEQCKPVKTDNLSSFACARNKDYLSCKSAHYCKWKGPKCTRNEAAKEGTSKTNDEEFNKHLIKCAHLKTNTICELYKNECSWTEVQETAEKESKEITPGRGTLGQECSSASCPCINKGLVCYHGFCHECVTDEDCPIYASCLSVKNFARQDNDKRLTKNVNLCVNSLEVPKLMKNFAPDAIASYRECYEMTKMANLWAMSNFVKDIGDFRNQGADISEGKNLPGEAPQSTKYMLQKFNDQGGIQMTLNYFIIGLSIQLINAVMCLVGRFFGFTWLDDLFRNPVITFMNAFVYLFFGTQFGWCRYPTGGKDGNSRANKKKPASMSLKAEHLVSGIRLLDKIENLFYESMYEALHMVAELRKKD